jgi:multidrug efflux pump subunit AcrB
LRDVQYGLPLDYPSLELKYDRSRAGQFGLAVSDISKSVSTAVSSSRFTRANYWVDKTSGNTYQVQVEFPQYQINSPEQIEQIPVNSGNNGNVYFRDVAEWKKSTTLGEYDRFNQQRYIPVTANIHDIDLGTAIEDVQKTIGSIGQLPKGTKISLRGQAELLDQTFSEMGTGLLLAIVVIFLLLSANFQSFKQSLIILSTIPFVVAGAFLLLLLTGKTLNIQSFMGIIMGIGVSVANAILLITNAEYFRKNGNLTGAGIEAGRARLRPILMTSIAMIAGMIPMSIGFGEAGEQTAPLGIAVIGGLLLSIVSTLFFLPLIYMQLNKNKPFVNSSLDPDDQESQYYGQYYTSDIK